MLALLIALAGATELPLQLRVADAVGGVLEGTHRIDVTLHTGATGDTGVFTETFTDVNVQNGYASVLLDVPPAHLRHSDLWVELTVDSITVLAPRMKVGSSMRTAEIELFEHSTSLPAGGGTFNVDHSDLPTDRLHVAVYRDAGGGSWTPIPYGPAEADDRYGSGRDGDIVLDGGTHSLEDLVTGYDGWDRVAEVDSLTLQNGATLTVAGWNGMDYGRVIVRARERIDVCATCSINVDGKGYRGGRIYPVNSSVEGAPGEGPGGGKAGWLGNGCGHGGGGGGGGYGTLGEDGSPDLDRCNPDAQSGGHRQWFGTRGIDYGDARLDSLFMGSGGASGSEGHNYVTNSREPGEGGDGGGAVGLWAPVINIQGAIHADGDRGLPTSWGISNPQVGSGGGGAGGAIRLEGVTVSSPGELSAVGGGRGATQGWGSTNNQANGQRGGAGGAGRIAIISATSSLGTTAPTPFVETPSAAALAPADSCGHTYSVVDEDTVSVDVHCANAADVRVVMTALP